MIISLIKYLFCNIFNIILITLIKYLFCNKYYMKIINNKTNTYLYDFIKNFLIGGTIIGIYSLVIKYYSAKLAGHASGALPLVFTYVVISTYILFGYTEAQKVSIIGFKGGFFWLSYTFVVSYMLKYGHNIIFSFCSGAIAFIVANYIYYSFFIK